MVTDDSMMMTLGVMSHCVESEKFGGHIRLQMDDQ